MTLSSALTSPHSNRPRQALPQYVLARLVLALIIPTLTPPPSPSFRLPPWKLRLQRFPLKCLSLIHLQPSPSLRAGTPPGQHNKNAPPSCAACRPCRRCLPAARTNRL